MYNVLLEPSRFENSSIEKKYWKRIPNGTVKSSIGNRRWAEFERKLTTNKEFRIKLVKIKLWICYLYTNINAYIN